MPDDAIYFSAQKPDFSTPLIVMMCLLFVGIITGLLIMAFGGIKGSLSEHMQSILSTFKSIAVPYVLRFCIRRR